MKTTIILILVLLMPLTLHAGGSAEFMPIDNEPVAEEGADLGGLTAASLMPAALHAGLMPEYVQAKNELIRGEPKEDLHLGAYESPESEMKTGHLLLIVLGIAILGGIAAAASDGSSGSGDTGSVGVTW